MKTKPFYLSKTNIINVLVVISTILAFVMGSEFPIPLDANILKWVILVQGVINIVLRFVTTGPIGKPFK